MAERIWQRLLFSRQGMHYFTKSDKETNAARSITKTVSEYMRSQGFHILDGMVWTQLSQDEAATILAMQLSEDMAYGSHRPDGISAEAWSLASQFRYLFSEDATFYSNGQYSGGLKGENMEATYPITDATFDGGIIGVDKDKIAYIWFEDED